jgi:CIC family chloride channel protein
METVMMTSLSDQNGIPPVIKDDKYFGFISKSTALGYRSKLKSMTMRIT